VAIVICVEAITEIIVSSELMFSIRDILSRMSPNFMGRLLNCGYCTSVWVSACFALFAPKLFNIYILDYVISMFVIHRLSNMLHELFKRWLDRVPFNIVIHKIWSKDDAKRD
jgi:hypothetical protein